MWNKNHSDRMKEVNSNWRANNKEYKQEYHNEWVKENPDKIRKYGKNHQIHNITKNEFYNCCLEFNFRCAYCGKTWEEHYEETKQNLHKEHVVHKGENDLSNCVPACRDCNSHKWEFTLDEWYNENNPIYSKERYDKIIWWINEGYKKYYVEKKLRKPYGSNRK